MSLCFHIVQTIKVLATHELGVSTQVRKTSLRKMDGGLMGVRNCQLRHITLLVVPQGPPVPPQPPVPQQPQGQQGQQGTPQPPIQPPWHNNQWPAWQRRLWVDNWYQLGYPYQPTDEDDPILDPSYRGPAPGIRVLHRQPQQPVRTPSPTSLLSSEGGDSLMGGTQNNNQPQANPPSLPVQVPSGSCAP